METAKKKSLLIITRFILFFLFNYLFFWYLLSQMGVEEIRPLGYKDSFGYFLPPYWFDLFIAFMTLLCYLICSGIYDLWKNSHDKNEISDDHHLHLK